MGEPQAICSRLETRTYRVIGFNNAGEVKLLEHRFTHFNIILVVNEV